MAEESLVKKFERFYFAKGFDKALEVFRENPTDLAKTISVTMGCVFFTDLALEGRQREAGQFYDAVQNSDRTDKLKRLLMVSYALIQGIDKDRESGRLPYRKLDLGEPRREI